MTENTHTIHHFAGSWHIDNDELKKYKHLFGQMWGPRVFKIKNLFRKILFRL